MPRSRTIGFGTGEGTEGVVVSPDIIKEEADPGRASAEYLREIRDRYCLPGGIVTVPFNLAANTTQKADFSQTEYNAIMLTVTAGVVQVFLGDFSGGAVGMTPHITQSAAIAPNTQTYPLPPGAYIFTVQADASGTCTGCLIPMAL